ncbi:MAG: Na/Pi cotransporter family protein, partial [Lawsonibacter sp.]|nr:Na/Pi cotransporter family protein [Lawsonibacter sp.]
VAIDLDLVIYASRILREADFSRHYFNIGYRELLIQSSSATTVMVVGFVNAGMMTLDQAVWIIMGANVGTTVTGLLIALDVGILAPLCAFAGVVMVVFVKRPKVQHLGQILAGLGVLFLGMEMMSASMAPLRHSAGFAALMSRFSNPLLGILLGAVFTAIIQSSSASVGILQSLAAGGVIPLSSAMFVLFGQNIGTCITAVLASAGANRNAKRATAIHLMFNLIGAALFTALVLLFPVAGLIEAALPGSPKAQIAAAHALFNVVTTLLLLPLGRRLARLAALLLPELPEEKGDGMRLEYLTPVQPSSKEGGLGSSAIYIDQLDNELRRMLAMAQGNVADSFRAVLARDKTPMGRVEQVEEYLDFLNKEISKHIATLITYETNEQSSAIVSSYFTITGNVERIGDHAMNICGYTQLLVDREIAFSGKALEEIDRMRDVCLQAIGSLMPQDAGRPVRLEEISALEQKIDDMTLQFRRSHLERMKSGVCSDEGCILYSELLTDFERIGDHVLNIGQELAAIRQAV